PVSIPNEVALSGERRRRLLAISSSRANASASVIGFGDCIDSRLHAAIRGITVAVVSTAIASRRLIGCNIAPKHRCFDRSLARIRPDIRPDGKQRLTPILIEVLRAAASRRQAQL